MTARVFVLIVAVGLAVSGCGLMRQVMGLPTQNDPSALKSAEPRWLLIKNPRFGDVPSEPEYIWVEEDKVPTTLTTLIRGKGAIIATPEIVAKYGPPPGGGRISARQGVPTPANPPPGRVDTVAKPAAAAAPGPSSAGRAVATGATANGASRTPVPAEPEVKRGLVLYVDTTRIVVDLTAADGLKPGTVLSLRRDRIPIVHPVTGEVLGELDEEIATARVTETRQKFSVAEIQSVTPGGEIQVRDRVVLK
jgi:hypothetical protein